MRIVKGSVFDSNAGILVSYANGDGSMSSIEKLIMKKSYPKTYQNLLKLCMKNELSVGDLYYSIENGIELVYVIVKEDENSKVRVPDVSLALDSLVNHLWSAGDISVAIAPIGYEEKGLGWRVVRGLLEQKLACLEYEYVDLILYEPDIEKELGIDLGMEELLLMMSKVELQHFSRSRLNLAASLVDLVTEQKLYKFECVEDGFYLENLDSMCGAIRQFQNYYKCTSAENARDILYKKLVKCDSRVKSKVAWCLPVLRQICGFINSLETEEEVICSNLICYFLKADCAVATLLPKLKQRFLRWSPESAERFSEELIEHCYNRLKEDKIIIVHTKKSKEMEVFGT